MPGSRNGSGTFFSSPAICRLARSKKLPYSCWAPAVHRTTASLSEIFPRPIRSDRGTAVEVLPVLCLWGGVCTHAGSRSHDIQRAGYRTTAHTRVVRGALSIPIGLQRVCLVYGVPVVMVSDESKWSGFSVSLLLGFGASNQSTGGDAAAVEVFGALAPLHHGETLNGRTGTWQLAFMLSGLESYLDRARQVGQHVFRQGTATEGAYQFRQKSSPV